MLEGSRNMQECSVVAFCCVVAFAASRAHISYCLRPAFGIGRLRDEDNASGEITIMIAVVELAIHVACYSGM